MSDYTMTITIDAPADVAEKRIREALADQGFGILSEIDVQAALQDKLGEDIGTYKILGACNPPLAHRAVQADPDIGALLPCNVLIRANVAGGTDIAAADPQAMMELAGDGMADVAHEAKAALQKALDAVSQAG